jgi:3-methyladenine DNA glycosylase/8-oxoguanine DNA glycosylase
VPELILAPVQPYSLAQSVTGGNPSRRFAGGVLETVFEAGGAPAYAQVGQRPDGLLVASIDCDEPEAAVATLRFLLALDVDHSPFLEMAVGDPLLRDVVSRRRGLRPMRTATVAQALLEAIAGQLITAAEARRIERRITAQAGRTHRGLAMPPTAADLRRLSPAYLTGLGLAPRRAAALARIVRTVDLDRLRDVDTARAVARIQRERTMGPWSAGVIALSGLGRFEQGPVGDLGLIRLCANLLGRAATEADTARLLAPYGDWSGLAGVHLLAHPLARRRPALAA